MRTNLTIRRSRSSPQFLASLTRDAELSLKRVPRAPFRMRLVTTLVYAMFGRFQIETLGLKFENYKR
jgi:hypothetical protein